MSLKARMVSTKAGTRLTVSSVGFRFQKPGLVSEQTMGRVKVAASSYREKRGLLGFDEEGIVPSPRGLLP